MSCGLFVGREVETRDRGRQVILVLDSYRISPMTSLSHHICEQAARHYQDTRFELLLSCRGGFGVGFYCWSRGSDDGLMVDNWVDSQLVGPGFFFGRQVL